MCVNTEEWVSARSFRYFGKTWRSTRPKVQVYRFMRRPCMEILRTTDMELLNFKLYLENRNIIEENEKLRQKADLLYQENLALVNELRKKFPPPGCCPSSS
ncbi:hypothetical protein SAY86_003722 [Trapa natans]|uniref:Uncharacterized protein n=1 Tax=Trapa natans TaxID=22666 RepID=A0AAN7MX59_TRANT|nr:hypothetical protein SAY86_003722 [Trapa natans]